MSLGKPASLLNEKCLLPEHLLPTPTTIIEACTVVSQDDDNSICIQNKAADSDDSMGNDWLWKNLMLDNEQENEESDEDTLIDDDSYPKDAQLYSETPKGNLVSLQHQEVQLQREGHMLAILAIV